MASLLVHQVPVLEDNYVYLVHEPSAKATAVVDPAVAEPVLEAAERLGWPITHILNTHHHGDHVGGNKRIVEETGCTVVGAKADRHRIPGIAVEVEDGDEVMLGAATAKVFFIPGHTSGHIAYWFADDELLFCGDTIFALGCGRLVEGTPEQMWHSLSKLRALPDATKVYCAHEYTLANFRFCETVEKDNAALFERGAAVEDMRRRDIPTVPSTLGEEKATNPFLRADAASVAAAVGLAGADATSVFAEVRRRKDRF